MTLYHTDELWLALQITDSSFPAGGFTNSFGIESAMKHVLITSDYDDLKNYTLLILEQVT
jgi:urease accessory protein UreF